MNPNDPVLVDEGKRVKTVIDGEHYYMYVSTKALFITGPRENSPDLKHDRKVHEQISEVVTRTLGGDIWDESNI